MKTYIALLRGINVSGQKMMKMADLLVMFNTLNIKNAKTYIQSGNVIFQYKGNDISVLQKKTEKKIKDTFGFEVPVIIIPAEILTNVLKNNPFIKRKGIDISRLYLTFLSGTYDQKAFDAIAEGNYGTDEYILKDKVLYLYFPNNYGNTKLTNNFWESKLKVIATTRNWKTMNKLKNMADTIHDS